MGTAAEELLEVLEGFIEVELADRRHYLALSRQAPAFARQQVRQLAEEAGCAARQLMAACYLITGECYRPAVECGRICLGRWCAAVRERYHAEACNGMNYLRAAESTTDPCLERLLTELGRRPTGRRTPCCACCKRACEGQRGWGPSKRPPPSFPAEKSVVY